MEHHMFFDERTDFSGFFHATLIQLETIIRLLILAYLHIAICGTHLLVICVLSLMLGQLSMS